MHLTVSLSEYGWHPAAWRLAGAKPPRLQPFADMAHMAEHAGIDVLLLGLRPVPDALLQRPGAARIHLDPLPLLGALIAGTRRIGLAAFWATDMAEPYHVARVFATLDHLSGGRTGWIVGRLPATQLARSFAYATPLSPEAALDRTVEFIDVTRKLWDSWEDAGFVVDQTSGSFADPRRIHPILQEGAYFTVRGPLNVPRPVQGQPVIIIPDPEDASARCGAARSVELVLAAREAILDAAALRTEWHNLLQRAGRATTEVRLLLSVMPILAASPAQAASRAENLDAIAQPAPADAAGLPAQRFVGTPAGLASMMAAWLEAGACDGFNIVPATAAEDLRLFLAEVVPLLQQWRLRASTPAAGTLRAQLGLRRAPSRFAA